MAHSRTLAVSSLMVADPETLICQGRTCLKWSADGELADPDRELVLARLMRVDAALAALLDDAGTHPPDASQRERGA